MEVELGNSLTGVVPFGDMRLEAVEAWQQDGVIEVLNEISIDTDGLDDIAKDKLLL